MLSLSRMVVLKGLEVLGSLRKFCTRYNMFVESCVLLGLSGDRVLKFFDVERSNLSMPLSPKNEPD